MGDALSRGEAREAGRGATWTALEEVEVRLLLQGLALHWGVDLHHWARGPLHRRLRTFLHANRLPTISDLSGLVLHQPEWRDRFLSSLTDGPAALFSTPDFWLGLRTRTVPLLRTYPQLRVWVPGCGTGADAWSLAILLEEEGLLGRTRILATELHDDAVTRASTGTVAAPEESAANLVAAGGRPLAEHLEPAGTLLPGLRRRVSFARHSLARELSPNTFHFILFRDVLLRFDQPSRENALVLLHQSLVPFGLLAIGRKASIRGTRVERAFQDFDADARILRRIG